jgi:hypothetical protein
MVYKLIMWKPLNYSQRKQAKLFLFYMKNVFLYFAPGGGKHPGSRGDVSHPFAAHLVVSRGHQAAPRAGTGD